MSLNESIVEDAALEWFGELGYAVGHGPQLAPGEQAKGTLTPALSQGEMESYGEVVLVRGAARGKFFESPARPRSSVKSDSPSGPPPHAGRLLLARARAGGGSA